MFSYIYNYFFSNNSEELIQKKPDQTFYSVLNDINKQIISIKEQKLFLDIGENPYKLDDIKNCRYTILEDEDEIEYNIVEEIQKTKKNIISFLHDYQYVISWNKPILNEFISPKKYKTKKHFENKIIYWIWVNEAITYIENKKEIILEKLLKIYSYLTCCYEYDDSFTLELLNNNYLFHETYQKNIFKNNENERITLYELINGLIIHEEGIYNDNSNTKEWGLYKSSFYNIIMIEVFEKIIFQITKQIENY